MLNFENYIDLPFIWGLVIATAIFLYSILDGFDLGVGILFPFAPSDKCRDRMMNSIAPFWDGNETWLVLGGGGLFAAFPLAYAILLPAFYVPITIMLLGLIMRGVAFEFRFKSGARSKIIWDYVFHFGSVIATVCQGLILGGFIMGVNVSGRNFAGGPLDWASGFSAMTGVALLSGYSLLGSTWLIMKTEGITQKWSRNVAAYSLGIVGIFMFLVSVSMTLINPYVQHFWLSAPYIYYLSILPIVTSILFFLIWSNLYRTKCDFRPFLYTVCIFTLSFIGLALSIFPWIIPYKFDIWEAAAADTSLSIMLVGVVPALPLILIYTAYCYYIFRGKTSHKKIY
ncbi:MAG: cytochrome d ubiquinol oxidase subunit II [Rickettsiaceae bacterium]|nr:cytochrome d ubiquinol oxidase subunit II [Rickettsiaceae bacterium]